jgi:ADP-heptose:LPS heptosyltransferase
VSEVEGKFKRLLGTVLKLFLSSGEGRGTIEKGTIRNILVIRQHDQLGDMLLAVPLLRALRESFPASHIALLASPVNYQIMLNNPYINDVINYDKRVLRHSFREIWKFYRLLRNGKYDLVVVPATISLSMTSHIIARLTGARIRIGAKSLNGISNPTAFCFTHAVELDWSQSPRKHHSARNLDILAPLDIVEEDLSSALGLLDDERKKANRFLSEYRKRYKLLVGFHPGAGHPENRWAAEKYASIAGRLAKEYDAGIVVTSGPMDREPMELLKKYLQCEYLLIESKPIREVAAIIDSLNLFLANDTGIMHVAGASKTNLLSIFGPSDPLLWAPIGAKNRYIASKNKTMEGLSEEEVYNMITIILNSIGFQGKKN